MPRDHQIVVMTISRPHREVLHLVNHTMGLIHQMSRNCWQISPLARRET